MRIGILTLFCDNKNYGALLQAYALPHFLNNIFNGESSFQCCYTWTQPVKSNKKLKDRLLGKSIFKIFSIVLSVIIKKIPLIERRLILKDTLSDNRFSEFFNQIPQTDEIFHYNSVEGINKLCSALIVGSDQVWNIVNHPLGAKHPFLLSFAAKEMLKISYAASMSVNSLPPEKVEVMIPAIEKIDFVSVREETAKKIIQSHSKKEVEVVCDPVLLLTKEQWNEVAVAQNQCTSEAYAYILGERKVNRNLCKDISKKTSTDICGVPYFLGRYNTYDKGFYDHKLEGIGPAEFLGLIRDTQFVLTDSFHATVFSIIFEKKFFVLLRHEETDEKSMNSRITDLLEKLKLTDRIITSKTQLTDEFLAKEIDFTYAKEQINEMRKASVSFLTKAFSGTELEGKLQEYLKGMGR